MTSALDPILSIDPTTATADWRGTAHVFVTETLRREILNGRLGGGTRLGQSDIAKHLGVSTTPVREALRNLASEGLVEIDPHRGAFVTELDDADVMEIYELRSELEPLALRLAMPQFTREVVDRLDRLHHEMNATPQLASWVALNRDFHTTMYQPAGRPRLSAMIASLQDGSIMAVGARLAHTSGVRDEANEEHARLVDAIRALDVELAVGQLRAHLDRHIRS